MSYPMSKLTKRFRAECADGQNVMAQFYFKDQRIVSTIQDDARVLTFDVKGRGNITIATGICYEKYDKVYHCESDVIAYAWTPAHSKYSAIQDEAYIADEAFDGWEIYKAIFDFFGI